MTEHAKKILRKLVKESGKSREELQQNGELEKLVENSPHFKPDGNFTGGDWNSVKSALEDNDGPTQRKLLVESLLSVD